MIGFAEVRCGEEENCYKESAILIPIHGESCIALAKCHTSHLETFWIVNIMFIVIRVIINGFV